MTQDTLSPVTLTYGRYEKKASDYLSSTDTVKGVDFAEMYEQDRLPDTTAYRLMLVSERVLAKYWDSPEEDEAWSHL